VTQRLASAIDANLHRNNSRTSVRPAVEMIRRTLRAVLWTGGWIIALGCAAWALGALHYVRRTQGTKLNHNARAKVADASPDFSELIRVGLPVPKRRVAQ